MKDVLETSDEEILESERILSYSYDIGKLIIYFNYLEHVLDDAICHLMDNPTRAMAKLRKMNYATKVAFLQGLCKEINEKNNLHRKTEIYKIVDDLLELGRVRNFTAHAQRARMTKNGHVRSRYIRENGEIIGEYKIITHQRLASNTRRMQAMSRKVHRFVRELSSKR